MRIVILHDGGEAGESETVLLETLRVLDRDPERDLEFSVVAERESAFLGLAQEHGLSVQPATLRPSGSGTGSKGAIASIREHAAEASIVHALTPTAALCAGRAASGAQSVIWHLNDRRLGWLKRRTIRRVTDCWVARSRRILEDAKIPIRHPFARVIPHPLVPARIRTEVSATGSGSPVVGMLGRFDLKENHHVFLEMARLVVARRSAVRFVIAGAMGAGSKPNRTYADSLGHLVRAWGLEDKVEFVARPSDLSEFFDSLDIFVEPSVRPGASLLGLFAMARGIPVIATNSGSFPDLIESGDTGWLTLPKDARGLAKACGFLLGNRDLARSMGIRGRDHVVANHGLSVVADRLANVYRELSGGLSPQSSTRQETDVDE